MSKRASIMFILSGLVLLYGLIDSFLLSGQSPQQALAAEAQTVGSIKTSLAQITDRIRSDQLRPEEVALLDVIEPPWARDPFADSIRLALSRPDEPKNVRDEPRGRGEADEPVYEGFMAIGGMKSAFISGAAYREGDRLPDGRIIVKEIAREAVMLEDSSTGEVRLLGMEKSPDAVIVF